MCEKCDAFVAKIHSQVARRGFTVVPVGTSIEKRGWACTIGLLDLKNHPELVVAGFPLCCAVPVLEEMGDAVVTGRRYDIGGPEFSLRGASVGVFPVDQAHLGRGLLEPWERYYEGICRTDLDPRAMQVVLPDADRCFEHQKLQPRLDNPKHVSFDGMNRSERRGHRGSRPVPPHPSTPRRLPR